MTFANPHRGEIVLQLGDVDYRLRPTFAALAEAEAETGSLIAVMERAGAGHMTMTDIAAILHCCAKAGGHDEPRDVFTQKLLAAGLAQTVAPLRAILTQLMTGHGDEST